MLDKGKNYIIELYMGRYGIAKEEYYHVYNRGVEKRIVFLDDKDRWRFLALLFFLQGKSSVPQINRFIPDVQHRMLDRFQNILEEQYVGLVSFCLMPNHFHLILQEKEEGSISKFMQRLANAYTKYFNLRHKRSGYLFEGKFKYIHIDKDEYLHYLSAYIHLNPRELKGWRGKEIEYPWSSFQDFAKENRWGKFLNPSVITDGDGLFYKSTVVKIPIKMDSQYLLE